MVFVGFIYLVIIYFFRLITGYCTGFLHMSWSEPARVKDRGSPRHPCEPCSVALNEFTMNKRM